MSQGNLSWKASYYNCHKLLPVLSSFSLLCLSWERAVFPGSLALTLEWVNGISEATLGRNRGWNKFWPEFFNEQYIGTILKLCNIFHSCVFIVSMGPLDPQSLSAAFPPQLPLLLPLSLLGFMQQLQLDNSHPSSVVCQSSSSSSFCFGQQEVHSCISPALCPLWCNIPG